MEMYHENLDRIVERAKRLGEMLLPYNFPNAPKHDEDDLVGLKTIETTVDGYEVVMHYNKADYGDHFLETFQVLGKSSPFLPFHLVTKLAQKFLGNDNLYLVELVQEKCKIYIWTLCVNKQGDAIDNPNNDQSEELSYEGFQYRLMNPKAVNFY